MREKQSLTLNLLGAISGEIHSNETSSVILFHTVSLSRIENPTKNSDDEQKTHKAPWNIKIYAEYMRKCM